MSLVKKILEINKLNIENILYFIILSYTFFGLAYPSESRPLLLIATLALFISFCVYKRDFFKSPSFMFILAAVFIATLTWILTNIQVPNVATASPRVGGILNKLAFIPMAFILSKSQKHIYTFFAVAILALLVSPWLAEDSFNNFKMAINGVRVGLGGHIITIGIIYSIVFLACLIFFKRLVVESHQIWRWVLWLIIFFAAVFGIVASQTRAIYLGFFIIYFLFFLFVLYLSFVSWSKYRLLAFYFFMVSFFVVLLIYFINLNGFFDLAINKAGSEQSVVWLLLSGEINQIPRNSAGLRIHFWVDSYNWIIERPLTGWGEKANNHLHAAAGNFFGERNFITVHNDIIDILLSYGFIGLIFYLLLVFWVYKRVFCSWKSKTIMNDEFFFFNIFLVFFIWNGFFMSLLHFKETIYLWNVVFAGFLALTLVGDKQKNRLSFDE